MNYTLIALVISAILITCATVIQQSRVEVFYVWPAEIDRGLCDTITVNTAAYYSRVKDQALSLDFLARNLEVSERYNEEFKVLGYYVVNMSITSGEDYSCVNVTVWYNLSWGQYVSKAFLMVVVLNRIGFTDPVTGEEYTNMTIALLCDRGRPLSVRVLGEYYLTYSHDNVWILIVPSSVESVVLEDWRGIRVEVLV
mgnify:CR=1 FL=1